ncbi:MAG: hypothetical protein AAB650_00285 [Patescibacteria group bacterium]
MFDQFKPLMQNGERYVVVEGGRPEYVLMRFQDYAALVGERKNPGHASPLAGRAGEWESVNAVLEEVGGHQPHFPAESSPPSDLPSSHADPTTIRLEDLPL